MTVSFSLRVSEAEYAAIAARAKADGSGICAWLRSKLDNPPEKLPLPDTRQVNRTKCIGFRATKEQIDHYAKTAEAAGQSVAWWARAVLLGISGID